MKTTFTFLFFLLLSKISYADENIRIYKLNCGYIQFKEIGYFSDTGDYDGKSGNINVPCYLIKHPKGNLIWDTGLSMSLMGKPNVNVIGATESVSKDLEQQLKQIGIGLQEIKYVAFSHLHADHAGNADLFKTSTWLIQKKEYDFATHTPAPIGINQLNFASIEKVTKNLLEGDYDVFGDGSVKIIFTPGHTPGHQSLLLNLKKSGNVILAGDLYHFKTSQKKRRIPIFNYSRAETLASIDRIETLAKIKNAKIIIQHEIKNGIEFPELPGYLE